jgi:hypothetical protein
LYCIALNMDYLYYSFTSLTLEALGEKSKVTE